MCRSNSKVTLPINELTCADLNLHRCNTISNEIVKLYFLQYFFLKSIKKYHHKTVTVVK
jgi:hypothetical protein